MGPTVDDHARQDHEHRAVDMAMYARGSPAETEAYIAWLTERTRGVIANEDWWSTIERLADELLAAGTIGYRRARSLVDETIRQRIACGPLTTPAPR